MKQIEAKIVADSISPQGHRITSMLLTYPRFIHSELMTHRMFSRNSASCLTADTIITIESPNRIKKGNKSSSNNMTIKEIVDKWIDGDNLGRTLKHRLKPMYLRCLNEDTGEFITTHITNCFRQGIQDVYEIELTNSYKIKCTKNHRIFTNKGWKTLNDINLNFSTNNILNWDIPNFQIATNGFQLTEQWLTDEKNKGKTLTQICNEYNLNYKSVSRFSEKYKIRFNKPILLNEDIHRFIHSNNLDIEFMNYYKEGKDLLKFQELYNDLKLKCDNINKPKGRSNTLVVRYFDIKNITYIGKEETYDLEVEGPYHNFIANKVVVHNSRAIPFEKMVKMIEEYPFIPIAWQKDHKGMQGTEYFGSGYDIAERQTNWLIARSEAVKMAKRLNNFGVTKQLCNRLLEPFMWHTVLVTATEFDNFFELRCPKYLYDYEDNPIYFKSKKDWINYYNESQGYKEGHKGFTKVENLTDLDWVQLSESGAEIHIQKIAEMMWDSYNESTPKKLEGGEWHIPEFSKLSEDYKWIDFYEWLYLKKGLNPVETKLKVSTARCARLSYVTLGDNPKVSYEADIKLHDKLLADKHFSPFEHCARVMNDDEYNRYTKGYNFSAIYDGKESNLIGGFGNDAKGWCNNFRGFIQYRYLIENR